MGPATTGTAFGASRTPRELLKLHFLEGLPYATIGARLGMNAVAPQPRDEGTSRTTIVARAARYARRFCSDWTTTTRILETLFGFQV
jgi:hypothetical protein